MKIINCHHGGSHLSGEGECGKPAVVLVVWENEHNGWNDSLLGASAACADHAPEEVHEARSSMSEDEYAIVNLPTPQAQVRWRVVDNVTGMTVSREFDREDSASAICREFNTPLAGGRYHVETNASGEWVRS